MMEDDFFCHKCVTYINPSYFRNKYLSYFFRRCKEHYEEYNELATFELLSQKVSVNVNAVEQEAYINILLKIKQANVVHKEYIMDQLEMFIKTSEFKKLHVETAHKYEAGDYDGAFQFTRQQIDKIDEIQFKHDDFVTVEEIDNILDKTHNGEDVEEVDIMGMEFPEYNNVKTWNGKIPKQGVTTVIAGYNVGKTVFMINSAYHAMKDGNKVLFVFHEGRKSHIVLRFLSRLTGINYNAIKTNTLNAEDQKQIEAAKYFITERLRIKEMTGVGATIEDLYIYAKNTMRDWPFDMLVSDYGGKLTSKNPYRELRHNLSKVWNTMDQMAHELNIAMLTAAQFNREGSKANKKGVEILRSENIAECITPAHVSEIVITLNRSLEDRLNNELWVCLDKGREAPDGLLIRCTSAYERAMSHDPKYGMTLEGYDDGSLREARQ